MAEYFPEHQEDEKSFGTSGKDTVMGGERYPWVGNFLSGYGASVSVVWIGIMSHVGGNGEYGGGNPCKIPKVYHREEGSYKLRQDVGDTGSQRVFEGN